MNASIAKDPHSAAVSVDRARWLTRPRALAAGIEWIAIRWLLQHRGVLSIWRRGSRDENDIRCTVIHAVEAGGELAERGLGLLAGSGSTGRS